MHTRAPAALALIALLATFASSQITPYTQVPTKDPARDKESPAKSKGPEPKYPDKVAGKDLKEWIKVLETDKDPARRELAVQALPNFDPAEVKSKCGKLLLSKMRPNGEHDAGVRIAIFNLVGSLGFEHDSETKDAVAILGTSANEGAGILRLTAVKNLGLFGHKAFAQTKMVAGVPVRDTSYEIRRAVAHTLGRIGYSDTSGPSSTALSALSGTLARDESTVVRLEALQSLFLLGPPWASVRKIDEKTGKVDDKEPIEVDEKLARITADHMRERLGTVKSKTGTETDRQIEMWCRLILLRFDSKEEIDPHLALVVAHLNDTEQAVKLQAMQILTMLGPLAARGKTIDLVVKQLDEKEAAIQLAALQVLTAMGEKAAPAKPALVALLNSDKALPSVHLAVLQALSAMGSGAKTALPELKTFRTKIEAMKQKRLANEDFKKLLASLSPEQQKLIMENLPEDQFIKVVDEAYKTIELSVPGSPGGPMSPSSETKKP
jgi:hypothetical protein